MTKAGGTKRTNGMKRRTYKKFVARVVRKLRRMTRCSVIGDVWKHRSDKAEEAARDAGVQATGVSVPEGGKVGAGG